MACENEYEENVDNLLKLFYLHNIVSFKVREVRCTAGSSSGDNYMSVVKRVQIKGNNVAAEQNGNIFIEILKFYRQKSLYFQYQKKKKSILCNFVGSVVLWRRIPSDDLVYTISTFAQSLCHEHTHTHELYVHLRLFILHHKLLQRLALQIHQK